MLRALSIVPNSAAIHLTPLQLLTAYCCGLFPMSDDRLSDEVFWVDPQERCLMPLDNRFHLSKNLRKRLRRGGDRVTVNAAFSEVMFACAQKRPERQDTWISLKIQQVTEELHTLGAAHSLEVWDDDMIIGGLYGLSLGAIFIGESMFSRRPDASKIALITLVAHLRRHGFHALDCQCMTDHLERFGAYNVSPPDYARILKRALAQSRQFVPGAATSLAEIRHRIRHRLAHPTGALTSPPTVELRARSSRDDYTDLLQHPPAAKETAQPDMSQPDEMQPDPPRPRTAYPLSADAIQQYKARGSPFGSPQA